jgi:hypothetical protein
MADATPSRSGQINATGAVDALWLKKFAGEVLTAFDAAKVLRPTIRVRTIESGKSAQFPATFRARARYHTPGTEIVGQKIKHNEVTVTLDDLLLADAFVASIDELKNHYDVRGPYATELGESLAVFDDRTIAQVIIKAARGAELFAGDGGGSSVTQANVGGSADFAASGADLISALNLAKQKMDEKRVPVDRMAVHSVFLPAQWYLMANSDKNLNQFYGGQSTVGHQALKTVSDINVYKSNAVFFGKDVTPYVTSTNTDGVVMDGSGNYSSAISAEDALPNDYPSKYQLDLTNTRGAVWVEPAVAYLQLLGMNMEVAPDPRRRGSLLIAEMAVGLDALRTKCAVEVKTS